jgi:hypothetical protein
MGVALSQQGWYKSTGAAWSQPELKWSKERNATTPVVRVIVREGQGTLYHEAQASIHTPDRTLRITWNQDSIAEFQSEYSQYWEYVEETGEGTGEDTQTDTSVSG